MVQSSMGGGHGKDFKKKVDMVNSLSKEDYSFFYENSVWEQYEDLVYAMQRGKIEEAIRIYKLEGIAIDEALRPVSSYHFKVVYSLETQSFIFAQNMDMSNSSSTS